MTFTDRYLEETAKVVASLDAQQIESVVDVLCQVRRRGGRLFLIGSGGGAGHASHAVCDFRKLGGFEAYCPTDNISELTARINDDGWETSIAHWLQGSRISAKDGLLVFSVGGGDVERSVSRNLVEAIQVARAAGASVVGIVGRNGGYAAQVADACVIVPTVNPQMVTPHTEGFQAVIWHLIVSHPKIQQYPAKW